MPVTINGTTGLNGNTTGTHTGAVFGDVTSTNQSVFNDLKLRDQLTNNNDTPILDQTSSPILQLKWFEYPEYSYIGTQLRVYEVFREERIIQKGNFSTFRLEADVFGYQVATATYRGNIGFQVVQKGPGGQGWTWAYRIYGTDGNDGDTWQGFYYQSNVHRTVFWQSPYFAGSELWFQVLVGGYDAAAVRWGSYSGYSKAQSWFSITEHAESQYPRIP